LGGGASFRSAAVTFLCEKNMNCKLSLICKIPIGAYAKGQRVTDEAEVRAIMRGRDRYRFALVRKVLREVAPAELAK
jgi:porphobilinogen deaminase